jgi:pimeloyl-ACP methyl ester carboxylesterase
MLHFTQYGSGSKKMLAFHGFGGTGNDWEVFRPALENDYTLFCFDIWHHGQSDYTGKPLSKLDFENEMNQFFVNHKIFRFSLLGYSLGGRICLQLAEIFPGKIEEIILFAPDGLHRNLLYRFATRTLVGNFLFKTIIQQPKLFFAGCDFFSKIKILHPKVNTFIHQQLGTVANRNRVYRSWRTTSRLWPNLNLTAENLVRYKIAITIYMGKYDQMVKTKWAKALTRRMPIDRIKVQEITASHNMQTEKVRKLIWGI